MHRTMLRMATLSVLAGFSMPAFAEVWHHAVSVLTSLEHDSNPEMSGTQSDGVWRFRAGPSWNSSGTYGRDLVRIGAALNLERSSDQSLSDDRQDPSISVGWDRVSELGGAGLAATYAKASTRLTELTDTGLLAADGTRSSAALTGYWRQDLDSRNSLNLDASYQSISYDGGALLDYRDLSAGLSWKYALDEVSHSFVKLTAGRYEPAATLTAFPSNNYGFLAGLNRRVSEKLDWTGQLGMTRTTGLTSDTGIQGGATINYQQLRSNWTLNVGRSISPSGIGGYITSDQLTGAMRFEIDNMTQTGLDLTWRRNSGANGDIVKQAGVWLGREITPFWSGRANLQLRRAEEANSASASGVILGVSLVYTHPGF